MNSLTALMLITSLVLAGCNKQGSSNSIEMKTLHSAGIAIPADEFPLSQPIIIENGIAAFDHHSLKGSENQDAVFLNNLPKTRCAYGACDCALYPFVMIPESNLTDAPKASDVLKLLKAKSFRSQHIKNLEATEISYPGYHPLTENDEIHTDSSEQAIFCKDGREIHAEEPGTTKITFSPKDSAAWHQALKGYVKDSRVFYVLLHSKKKKHGEYEFSDWVLLFAVGVSPKTGNLVGAVTYQACHNYCD